MHFGLNSCSYACIHVPPLPPKEVEELQGSSLYTPIASPTRHLHCPVPTFAQQCGHIVHAQWADIAPPSATAIVIGRTWVAEVLIGLGASKVQQLCPWSTTHGWGVVRRSLSCAPLSFGTA